MTEAELGLALVAMLEPYRTTSHGENDWTLEAAQNVLRIRHHIEAALKTIGGRLSSCYRSQAVNVAVHGSVKSRHLVGLAADICPGLAWDIHSAASVLWHLANSDKLGAVHQIIHEPGWIHIGWHRLGEVGEPGYLKFNGKFYSRVA